MIRALFVVNLREGQFGDVPASWGRDLNTQETHNGSSGAAIAAVLTIVGIAFVAFERLHWFWALFLLLCLSLWLFAWLMLTDARMRGHLTGTLKHSRYTQIYTYLTKSGVDRIWNSVCAPADDKASWPTLFRAALTGRLYDKALLLALTYPILLLVAQWIVTGAEGRVGSIVILSGAEFWPERTTTLLALLILMAGKVGYNFALASQRPALQKASVWLAISIVGFAFAFAWIAEDISGLAVSTAIAITGISLISVGAAIPYTFGTGVAAGIVGAGAAATGVQSSLLLAGGAAVLVAAATVALEFLDKHGKPRIARALLTCTMILALLIAVLALDWPAVPEDHRSLFLFFAALPLFNALFDVISYAVTLSLIRRGLNSRWPFLWGLLDLAIACVLFLGLGFTLVVLVHGLNVLAGVPFVDLQGLFAGFDHAPGDHIWLYLMLFSTVLPTALHGMVSLIGLQGIWPKSWRRKLAGLMTAAPESLPNSVLASGVLGVVWAIPIMGLVLLGWLVLWLGEPAIHYMLELYFKALLWGAAVPIGAI